MITPYFDSYFNVVLFFVFNKSAPQIFFFPSAQEAGKDWRKSLCKDRQSDCVLLSQGQVMQICVCGAAGLMMVEAQGVCVPDQGYLFGDLESGGSGWAGSHQGNNHNYAV